MSDQRPKLFTAAIGLLEELGPAALNRDHDALTEALMKRDRRTLHFLSGIFKDLHEACDIAVGLDETPSHRYDPLATVALRGSRCCNAAAPSHSLQGEPTMNDRWKGHPEEARYREFDRQAAMAAENPIVGVLVSPDLVWQADEIFHQQFQPPRVFDHKTLHGCTWVFAPISVLREFMRQMPPGPLPVLYFGEPEDSP